MDKKKKAEKKPHQSVRKPVPPPTTVEKDRRGEIRERENSREMQRSIGSKKKNEGEEEESDE